MAFIDDRAITCTPQQGERFGFNYALSCAKKLCKVTDVLSQELEAHLKRQLEQQE